MGDNRVPVRLRKDAPVIERTVIERKQTPGGESEDEGDSTERTTYLVNGINVEPLEDGRYLVHPDRAERLERDGLLEGEDQPNQKPNRQQNAAGQKLGTSKAKADGANTGEDEEDAERRAAIKENRAMQKGEGDERHQNAPTEPSGRRASDVGKTRQQLQRQANSGGKAHDAKTGGDTRALRRKRERELPDEDDE